MNIVNFQKFIGAIIIGYFGVKIYYNLFIEETNFKSSDEELNNFSTTCIFAAIVFLFTNYTNVMNNSFVFYIGFIFGLNVPLISKLLLGDALNSLKTILGYVFLGLYSVLFIYFYFTQMSGYTEEMVNPLIILISVVSVVSGLLLNKYSQLNQNPNKNKQQPLIINVTPGFLCWIGSLLLVHSQNNNYFVSGIQAVLIGAFVAYFSYYKPEYIFDTIKKTDKPSMNLHSYYDLRDMVLTNRWISGLSLVTVFVLISMTFIKGESNNLFE